MSRIFTVQLRTTDVEHAKAFYDAVLEGEQPLIFELHEQARARGARPHWLGRIDGQNLDRALAAVTGLGASRFGCYRDVFGWRLDEPVPLPSAGVVNHPFAWQADTATVGAMADIAERPGVHALLERG